MDKPKINPKYNVLTLLNMLSTSMHGDLNTEQWEQYFAFDAKMIDEVQKLLQRINDWHVVDNAQGRTLDLLGNDFGVARNGANDDFYRFKIKTKRYERVSDGTCNALYKLVSSALSIDPHLIWIHENQYPNQVVIDNIPADLVTDNAKTKLLMQSIQNATAYGVKIVDVSFITESISKYDIYTGASYGTEIVNVMHVDDDKFTTANLNVSHKSYFEDETTNIMSNLKEGD